MQPTPLHCALFSSTMPLLSLDPSLVESAVLPHLSAFDLGHLACTCKHWLAVVINLDADTWHEAAAAVFFPQHLLRMRQPWPVSKRHFTALVQCSPGSAQWELSHRCALLHLLTSKLNHVIEPTARVADCALLACMLSLSI